VVQEAAHAALLLRLLQAYRWQRWQVPQWMHAV
jgi:hypothetical protein